MDSATRPSITENPWFWLMLFGGMGVLGIVVIGPKYAVREARRERMAETRARVVAARDAGVPTVAGGSALPAMPDGGPQVPPAAVADPYLEADYHAAPRLGWLLGLVTLTMLVGAAGLIVSRRRLVTSESGSS